MTVSNGAYSVTVGGGGSGQGPAQQLTLNVTTLKTNSIANAALAAINNDPTGNTLIIGGVRPGGYGVINTLAPTSALGIIVNNTDPTSVTLPGAGNGQIVYSGIGVTTITAGGQGDTIISGGGFNTINFTNTSTNSLFLGDGQNVVNVNTASGATTIFGTSASSDTILGGSSGGGSSGDIYYVSAAGSMALIDPGAHNATVIGTAGGTETVSVFGGLAFTGNLTVTNGTGYFQGGSNGGNSMASSTVGGTTLVGGGQGDILKSMGKGDILKAGSGLETMVGAGALGYDQFWASTSTATGLLTMSALAGNNKYLGASIEGSFIDMHLNGAAQTLGSSVEGTVTASSSSAQFATIADFISSKDKLVLTFFGGANTATSIASGATIIGGQSVNYSTVTASNGSVFTFLGTTIKAQDIVTLIKP
jgi:hypothetical protein